MRTHAGLWVKWGYRHSQMAPAPFLSGFGSAPRVVGWILPRRVDRSLGGAARRGAETGRTAEEAEATVQRRPDRRVSLVGPFCSLRMS